MCNSSLAVLILILFVFPNMDSYSQLLNCDKYASRQALCLGTCLPHASCNNRRKVLCISA